MTGNAHAAAPLISVVVPSYNSVALLEGALRSLAEQSLRDFELVLSDGGSQDGTTQLARHMTTLLPSSQLHSRPDRGVYDAINLGVATARGQWVLILGSDDRLHAPDTLERAAGHLRTSRAAIVYGDVQVMSVNRLGVPPGGRYAGPMPLARLLRGNICQQSIFYRRTLFDELGGFDLRYPVQADWEFNVRAAFRVPMQWVDLVVADYAATGMSARRRDAAAERDVPELIRRELLRCSGDRSLWALQRVLLRQADVLRRRRRWRAALRQLGSYALLMARRLGAPAREP